MNKDEAIDIIKTILTSPSISAIQRMYMAIRISESMGSPHRYEDVFALIENALALRIYQPDESTEATELAEDIFNTFFPNYVDTIDPPEYHLITVSKNVGTYHYNINYVTTLPIDNLLIELSRQPIPLTFVYREKITEKQFNKILTTVKRFPEIHG